MKHLIYLILFISLSITAKADERLQYEVLTPAPKALPKDVKTLLFAYRNIQFETDSITQYYMYNGETFKDTTNYQNIMAEGAYKGFINKIQAHYPTDTIRFITLPRETKMNKASIPLLDWTEVDTHCKRYNADVLVCLDDIVILNNYHSWYEDVWVGITDIKSYYQWTVYDPLTQEILINETKLDTIQTEERSHSLNYLLKQKMPRRNEIANIVAFSIGQEMAETITPNWKHISRTYYDKGTAEMRKANLWVRQEKWLEAINEYKKVSKNAKQKARALYNIAVMYERLGQIDNASESIQKSIQLYDNQPKLTEEKQLAIAYNSFLKKRKREVLKLKNQANKQ